MPVDMQKMKEQLDNMSQLGFSTYKPRYGKSKTEPAENVLKLLSWPAKGGPLAKRVLKHFNLGHDGKQQEICPKTFGSNNRCVICDWVDAATRSEDPTLSKRATSIRQQERYMQLVIDINALEKDPTKKVVAIYDCPPKVHRTIMQTMTSQSHDFTEWSSALVQLTCYDQGQGKPKAVEFVVALHNMAPRLMELDPAEWLSACPDVLTIKSFAQPASPARLQALLDGRDPNQVPDDSSPAGHDSNLADDDVDMTPSPEPAPAAPAKPEVQKVAEPAKPAAGKKTLADLIAESKAKKA